MARKLRIEFEGGFYHVITRGNQRQKVFIEEKDFLKYLEFLSDYKDRYGFWVYAYVLMGTHVHLLIETGQVPLSKILQGINQRFTMYFNRRYGTVGHLFQGRYKAILCDRDAYLLSLVKYLHCNPVRAGMVRRPEEYRWSSHREYIGLNKDGLVDTGLVMGMFSKDLKRGRRLYVEYMREDEKASKEDFYRTVDQRVLEWIVGTLFNIIKYYLQILGLVIIIAYATTGQIRRTRDPSSRDDSWDRRCQNISRR